MEGSVFDAHEHPACRRAVHSGNSEAGRFLGEGAEDYNEDSFLGQEIFHIFAGTHRPQPNHPCDLKPPSRNSNPLVRDHKFSAGCFSSDSDLLASRLDMATGLGSFMADIPTGSSC
jgi:hypothetical protein